MSDKSKQDPFPHLEIGGLYAITHPQARTGYDYLVWLCPDGEVIGGRYIVLPESSTILYLGNRLFLDSHGEQGFLIFNYFSVDNGIRNQLVKVETSTEENE